MIKGLAGFLMSIILLTAIAADCSGGVGTDDLKVYAVKYGTSLFPRRFIFNGDSSSDKLPFTWLFYYIEYNDRKILVDTGFNNEKLIKMFEISGFRDPVEILNENGISPESITDVIITHSHFDHIGTLNCYPNARIIINKRELDSFMKGHGLEKVRSFLKNNSRVYTFDKSITLFDFFRIERVGGHTEGSSVVFFRHSGIEYCMTGDEIYLEENISDQKGNGSVVNSKKNLTFIKELNKSGAKPLTFHDNRYFNETKNMIPVIP